MMKIIICVFLIIGAVYSLPMADSFNQRDPGQIKTSNDDPVLELVDSSDPDRLAKEDENLESAESRWGRRYGGWGRRHGGWGRGYGGWGYGGFGHSIIVVPGYYGGFGGFGPGYWW